MEYQLEKYNGRNSRHECPQCHDAHSFAYYINESGQIIDVSVGRCNHESSCGYHCTPREWYQEHPTNGTKEKATTFTQAPKVMRTQPDFIPMQYVTKSISYASDFIYFLCGIFDRDTEESPTIERIMKDYLLGATKVGDVIFWQIDVNNNVRTGKIIRYDKTTGHRSHEAGGVNWIHSLMKKRGLIPEEFNLSQCLFGEHLLKKYPDKVVALVEAEKTAVIGSGFFPDYVWLATGGKSQLSIDKMKVLCGRTVIMFPDVDGFSEWCEKAKELTFCNISVSDILERNATDEERANHIDIADWLIIQKATTSPQSHAEARTAERDKDVQQVQTRPQTQGEKDLSRLIEYNPLVGVLVNKLDLIAVN